MKKQYQLIMILTSGLLFQVNAYGFFDNLFGGYRGGSTTYYETTTNVTNVYLDTAPITQALQKIEKAIDKTRPTNVLNEDIIKVLEKQYKISESGKSIGINLGAEDHKFVAEYGYPALMNVIEDRMIYKQTNTAIAVAFAKAMKNQSITSTSDKDSLNDPSLTVGDMDFQRLFGFIDFVRRNPKATDKEVEDRARLNASSSNPYVKSKSLFSSDLKLTPEQEIKALKYLATQINDPANGVNFSGIDYNNFKENPDVFLLNMIAFNKHVRADLANTESAFKDIQKFCSSVQQSKTLKEPPYMYALNDNFRGEIWPKLCELTCDSNKNQINNLSAGSTLAKLKETVKEWQDKAVSGLKNKPRYLNTFSNSFESEIEASQKNCRLYQCTKKAFDHVCSSKWKDPTENRQTAQVILQKYQNSAVTATAPASQTAPPSVNINQ